MSKTFRRTITVKVLDDGNEDTLMTCETFSIDAQKFLDLLVTSDRPESRFDEVSKFAMKNLKQLQPLYPLKIAIDGNSEESKKFCEEITNLYNSTDRHRLYCKDPCKIHK